MAVDNGKMEAEYVVLDELAHQYVELAKALGMQGYELHDEILKRALNLYDFYLDNSTTDHEIL